MVLQAQLRTNREREAKQDPDSEAKALVWIQTGRFHVRNHQARQARTAYAQAARLLIPIHHREWGAVESGLGCLAQQTGQLAEAERCHRAALDHFVRGAWPSAVHVQYNNLAAVCYRLNTNLKERDAAQADTWLDAAVRWSRDAQEFAEQIHPSGVVNLKTQLV